MSCAGGLFLEVAAEAFEVVMWVKPFVLLRVRMASARLKVVRVRCLSAVAASDLSSLEAL